MKSSGLDKTRRAAIDEYDSLERWHSENKLKIDRHGELAKEIRGWSEEAPAANPVRYEGTACYVDLTACKEMRRITNMAKAWRALEKAMGIAKLIDAITITFKLLDKHVPAAAQEPYVVKETTGPRTITVTAKASASAA